MAGGIFAGHDQCEGELIEKNGKKYKLFYGMSSDTAMQKHAGMNMDKTQNNKEYILPFKLSVNYTGYLSSISQYYIAFLE